MKSTVTKMILIPYERYKALLGEQDIRNEGVEEQEYKEKEEKEEKMEEEEEEEEESEDVSLADREDCPMQSGSGSQKQEDKSELAQRFERDITPPPPGLPANTRFLSLDKEQTQDGESWKETWLVFKA